QLGISVAIETPFHVQAGGLAHQRHLIDAAMAAFATDPFGDVNAVIEIDEIRYVINARPGERLALLPAFTHRRKQRAVPPDNRVAADAGLGRWHAGKRRRLDAGMAIATVESQTAHMMIVTERHGLIAHHIDLRDVR